MNRSFLFVCCQPGAEAVVKNELSDNHSDWRFAFSRPGFLTFKWAGTSPCSADFQLKANFARTYGWSLGELTGGDDTERISSVIRYLDDGVPSVQFQHLHVWHRQSHRPQSGVPKVTNDTTQGFAEALQRELLSRERLTHPASVNRHARRDHRVVDCIQLADDRWWLGWHEVKTFGQRWPGGVFQVSEPAGMVSRAYLKMKEMLAWSELPIASGQACVEIGSAPGGASQALLELGLHVTGVDPAQMHPDVSGHPRFSHIRKRGSEVRRVTYAPFRWLFVDVNLVPDEMLAMVESIVTHEATHVHGMLLTLKLPNWQAAQQVNRWVARVRSWGYEYVRCRQLSTNHQEVCLAAMRSRGMRRLRKRRSQRPQRPRRELAD